MAKSIEQVNYEWRTEKGAKFTYGSEGNLNYFVLGRFPQAGAYCGVRLRCWKYAGRGFAVSFKLRLMPDPEAPDATAWNQATNLKFLRGDNTRKSGEWGIGIGALTIEEVQDGIKEVEYVDTLSAWLSEQGMVWDEDQRAKLQDYLLDGYAALIAEIGEFTPNQIAQFEEMGRLVHFARAVVTEAEIAAGLGVKGGGGQIADGGGFDLLDDGDGDGDDGDEPGLLDHDEDDDY